MESPFFMLEKHCKKYQNFDIGTIKLKSFEIQNKEK